MRSLGPPDSAEVRTFEGEISEHVPECVVTAAPWQLFKEFVVDEIAIVDFGEAYEPARPPRRLAVPRAFADPEITFGKLADVGFHSDMSSLACTLLEVRLDSRPDGDRASVLRWMERLIGPLPHPCRATAKKMLLESQGKAYNGISHPSEDVVGGAGANHRPY